MGAFSRHRRRGYFPPSSLMYPNHLTISADLEHPGTPPRCIALATGMKCAPASHLTTAQGTVLHDSHAEILALRALSLHLLRDATSSSPSLLLRTNSTPAFRLRPSVRLHMYASTCPCGDASMELVMARQNDSTPWPAPAEGGVLGRGHFSLLGVVRRKPARADAPLAVSKSCSDKLALRAVIGLVGGPVGVVVEPASVYLSSLVMPEAEIDAVGVERAWGKDGRMKCLQGWPGIGGFACRPFRVVSTVRDFEFGRDAVGVDGLLPKPSEKAVVVWGDGPRDREVVINGVLQGRKRGDPRAAAAISRRRTWALCREVADMVGDTKALDILSTPLYRNTKQSQQLADRMAAKRHVVSTALTGWQKDESDLDWGL